MFTVGISPKVKLPALALLGIGVVLALLGVVTNDTELIEKGVALIGASGLVGGIGYRADPGVVRNPAEGEASDDALSDEAKANLIGDK